MTELLVTITRTMNYQSSIPIAMKLNSKGNSRTALDVSKTWEHPIELPLKNLEGTTDTDIEWIFPEP